MALTIKISNQVAAADAARLASLRQRIAEGRYVIDADAIARALLRQGGLRTLA